ncbi:hypothetical protein B9Z65_4651 [Elsinoe australis]|uniref:Uncharacterized protein n=1 Tax=Elsinoe australis TaxID=40998 RepID=A0A2P8A5M2_9PEZI|nr:hypothetical protein B9Z65_4651 [Elsinoe australis]
MGDRRPLSSLTSGDFDHPPATITLAENVRTRLNRLHRTLERNREESNNQAEAARHERWGNPPSLRRRRLLRPAESHSPTYEGRSWPRSDDSHEDEDERPRHAKRRKLDLYSHSIHEKAFRYGHYGQVEQGRLKMELCSCDGGVYDERGPIYYGPSNILKHDQSVYCSKSSQCNIILRHHDNTAFCLEKLYILAPEHGFTAPVKHGTVCVGMGLEDLMPLAADALLYGGQERQPSPDEEEGDDQQLSLLESLRDPEISRAMRQRDYEPWNNPPPYPIPEPLPPAQGNSNRDGRVWSGEFVWPPLEPTTTSQSTRPEFVFNSPPVETTLESGMRVNIDHSGEINWPEEPTTAAVLADRQRRERHARDEDFESDDEHSRAWDPRFRTTFNRLRRGVRLPRDIPRNPPSQSSSSRKPAVKDVTQVRFSMQHGKDRVAIEFVPPISGTCILLQLQSASFAGNVDIQTVIACGYAGPRFLPAVTLA